MPRLNTHTLTALLAVLATLAARDARATEYIVEAATITEMKAVFG